MNGEGIGEGLFDFSKHGQHQNRLLASPTQPPINSAKASHTAYVVNSARILYR